MKKVYVNIKKIALLDIIAILYQILDHYRSGKDIGKFVVFNINIVILIIIIVQFHIMCDITCYKY